MGAYSKMPFKRPASMQDLFADDPYGILADVGEKKITMSVSDKVQTAFQSVAQFIRKNNRLPKDDCGDFEEELLAREYQRLVIQSPEGRDYCESLLPEELRSAKVERVQRTTLTRDEIIKKQVEDMQSRKFENINDVMDADPFGLLDDSDDEVIAEHEDWRDTEEYQARRNEISEPVARTKKCFEFDKYKPYFEEAKALVAEGHLKAEGFLRSERDSDVFITYGQIYIIDGVSTLIVEADFDNRQVVKATSKEVKYRVRQIFDNGTECSPFSTSLKSSFYKSKIPCKRLAAADAIGEEFFSRIRSELDPLFKKLEDNKPNGYVYILGTLSKNPVIREFSSRSSLVKIGYTDRTVNERISDAEKSATYLFAPVEVLYEIACYNFNAHRLEEALHTILAPHRLSVTLLDANGVEYKPEEWFTVSAETACQIVDHIMAKDLHNYYVDPIQGKLKLKQQR